MIRKVLNFIKKLTLNNIANLAVIIGVLISVIAFNNANNQYKENLRNSELLYRKDSLLLVKQIELSNEPVIKISNTGIIHGNNKIFELTIENCGVSDIQNIFIKDTYYVANKPRDGNTTLYQFGPIFLKGKTNFNTLQSRESKVFTIDLNLVYEDMTEFYLSAKGNVHKLVNLAVSYERKVDGKLFHYNKLYGIGGNGEVLIDNFEDDIPVLQDMISSDEIKKILYKD